MFHARNNKVDLITVGKCRYNCIGSITNRLPSMEPYQQNNEKVNSYNRFNNHK